MDDFVDDPLGLDPLSPPRCRDPRWFIPAHAAGIPAPREVFPTWRRAQLEVDRLAGEAPLAPGVLRTTGFLRLALAQRVADWFTGKPAAPAGAVRRSYQALERETARLFEIVHRAPSSGGLGAFATWLQCRTLFSHDARGAAFYELVGATTTYIVTGEKPGLRADLPPAELVAACMNGAARDSASNEHEPRPWHA